MTELILGLALIAVVLVVSALASGIVERAPLSFPMIFLGLGFLLGPQGLRLIQIEPHSFMLEAVGVICLALVLFLDAIKIQVDELRSNWWVPMLVLGPGTLLIIVGIAVAAYLLLGATPIQSLLLGAILASTDPVVLRDVIRDERLPRSIRQVLSVEAGMNDIVVLPIVLILIAVLTAEAGGALDWLRFLAQLFILSPLVGLLVGGVGAWLMNRADAYFGIRREHQALYGIGLVLAAYTAGQAVQGDGFLAAFFAGLAITLFNISLCECFLEYGEITAEMAMLLAFVLFGALLSTLLGSIPLVPALLLALIVLGIARPVSLGLVLQRATMSQAARLFIGWFGPRGLSSLLFALLVVQANAPGGEYLLALTGIVVTVSVIAHGASATPFSAWYARLVARETLAEEREATAPGLFQHEATEVRRITPAELAVRLEGPQPPVVLDVRSRAQYERDNGKIPGSIRVQPDQIETWAAGASRERSVVAYCT